LLLSTLTVLNLQDSGSGSLRQAIVNAASGDTINFAVGLSGTIELTSGALAISKDLTITGPGPGALTISGNDASRIFNLSAAAINISGLTLTQGSGTGGIGGGAIAAISAPLTLDDCVFSDNQSTGGNGGAVASVGDSSLLVSDCTFTNNSASNNGGAIDSLGASISITGCTFDHNSTQGSGSGNGGGALSVGTGTVTITNSTFFGNIAPSGQGGAINSNFAATFTLLNDTIDGNSAGASGGGISQTGSGTFNLANSIVADNSSPTGPDISGSVTSQDYNLIRDTSGMSGSLAPHDQTGVDPLLGPLAANGGHTPTQALGFGSPAIDVVPQNAAPATDQRGIPRLFGSAADIGAFEASLNYFFVLTPNDSGAGSLRQAILDANAAANRAGGPDVIQFNIPGSGVQVVQPLSSLPTITDPVFLDGYSQPGATSNTLAGGDNAVLLIRIDGSAAGAGVNGLVLNANTSTVRGLSVTGFGGDGLDVGGSGNTLAGNFIGLLPDSTTTAGNGGDGVRIVAASSNVVGGTTPADRNIISGNTGSGVDVVFAGATGNLIQGNFIGTDASGSAPRGNGPGFLTAGVNIGVGASNNTVGGGTAGAGNVISGNTGFGVHLLNAGTSGNRVQGNRIGTDVTGTAAVGNTSGGIEIDNFASGNFVGTDGDGVNDAAEGNLISGNQGEGVQVGFNGTADGNVIAGNFIGTDVTGTAALGNQLDGIAIGNATNTRVGTDANGVSDALERNVISGNGQSGVSLSNAGTSGNVIAGNYIGTDAGGTASLGGQFFGVLVSGGPSGNLIGGNVISGNTGTGVEITGNGTSNNTVGGNFIGTDKDGTAALGNTGDGVVVGNGATANMVGGTTPGAGNTIAFNHTGVSVVGASTTGDSILGNAIFGNAALGIDLGGDGPTPNDVGDTDTGPNSLQNSPVLASVSGTAVSGFLDSAASTTYRVEFFANTAYDASGVGEGEVFLGATTVTGATGPTPFSFSYTPVAGKPFLTATATNLSTGDTSEFSAQDVPPTIGAPATASVNEDLPLAFTGADAITVSDADNNGTDAEQLSLSVSHGTLTFATTVGLTFTSGGNGTAAVTVTGTVTALNAALAGLTYATKDYSGPDTLMIGMSDLVAPELGGPQTVTASVALTVNFVNDQPSFTGSDQTAVENSGAHVVPGWAGFNPGPVANEANQTATYTVTGVSNPGLFSLLPAVDANGTLTYALAPNVFGSSTFTVQVQDSGGTAHGGIDLSLPHTFDLTVTPITVPLVVTPNVLVGTGGHWLQVQGINFTPASVVLRNGKPLRTRFVSSTLLLAHVPRFTLPVGTGQLAPMFTLHRGQHFVVLVRTPGMATLGPVGLRVVRRFVGLRVASRERPRLAAL
jgi:predicted outer membrane repeat protein